MQLCAILELLQPRERRIGDVTVIRFKIGDAFPANDPLARFIAGLAMISNDWLRSVTEMVALADDTPEEIGRRISLFRRQAALVHETATFITDVQRKFPQVASSSRGSMRRHATATRA